VDSGCPECEAMLLSGSQILKALKSCETYGTTLYATQPHIPEKVDLEAYLRLVMKVL
jgi:hypothetical protein